jgi:hypothetical protein
MVSSAYLRLMFCYKDTITVSHYHIKNMLNCCVCEKNVVLLQSECTIGTLFCSILSR